MWIWIVGAVILVALAVYAIYLQTKLKQREKQRAVWREEVGQVVQDRTEKITNSIVVISGAMLEGQLDLSECCIRLSSLLNQLGPIATEDRFQSIHKAAESSNSMVELADTLLHLSNVSVGCTVKDKQSLRDSYEHLLQLEDLHNTVLSYKNRHSEHNYILHKSHFATTLTYLDNAKKAITSVSAIGARL